jgi:hypothetical protein
MAIAVLALAMVTALAFAQGPTASLAGTTQVELDTFSASNTTPLDVAGPVLEDGRPYTITVTGTFSYWFAHDWETHGTCPGAVVEPMPVFTSPGTENGPVHGDAAWYFGGPNNLSDCDGPFPDADDPLGISLDGGDNWNGIDPDDRGSAPNPEHTYHLTVIGQGEQVFFGIDDEKTEDNYGIIRFAIEPALVWADNDCSGGITAADALPTVLYLAGLDPGIDSCPATGDSLDTTSWGSLLWSDLDCSDSFGAPDIVAALREAANLTPATVQDCPTPGDVVIHQLS